MAPYCCGRLPVPDTPMSGPPGRDNFALDLDIAEGRSGFSSQLAVHIGLLRSSIFGFGEEMVPNFVRKRTCDSGALPDCVLVNNDLHTGNKIGAVTGSPPFDTQVVAISLCETRSKCWGFRQKRRQRGIGQWRSRTTCGSWSATLLRLRQCKFFITFHGAAPSQ